MASLYAFLNPEPIIETKEVFVSDRFKDENGKVVPFKIRNLAQEESNRLVNRCRKFKKEGGTPVEYLDSVELSKRIVVESTVEPNFKDPELCAAYGTLDPLEVPGKMLRNGEYKVLLAAIEEMSETDLEDLELPKN